MESPKINVMNYPIDFRNPDFLTHHIKSILAFYDRHAFDINGGFYHCLMNNGMVFDRELRTLVASCRFIFNYAKAHRQFGNPEYLALTRHGLQFLRQAHRNPKTGGYIWSIRAGLPVDTTNHCYGLAFVLLAYASATEAGCLEATDWIYETYDLMEQHFWLEEHGLYACEADAEWRLTEYRGQNDNMHACEALIAAFEATGDELFLGRAQTVAANMVLKIAAKTDGQIWEHYDVNWAPDYDYGKGDNSNHIRPWGFQTGHQTEWAKLLLILDRHGEEPWRLASARALFDRAMLYGWDKTHGGLIYGYDLTGKPCDTDKYFWVQAESIAAAALLANRTNESGYWDWYTRIWDYSFHYFVDHTYGAWYRILNQQNRRYDERKSYNNKADYHTMGACYEALKDILGMANGEHPATKLNSRRSPDRQYATGGHPTVALR